MDIMRGVSLVLFLSIVQSARIDNLKFSWHDCNADDTTTTQLIDIQPDPVVLPGTIYITIQASGTADLVGPAQMNLTIDKKVGDLWVNIPCVGSVGSCTYADICSFINVLYPPTQACPEGLSDYGVPCHCPFPAGSYNISAFPIMLDIKPPPIITDGDYHLGFQIASNGTEILCHDVYLTLQFTENPKQNK